MSTRAHPIVFIGITFENSYEVLEYLNTHNIINSITLAEYKNLEQYENVMNEEGLSLEEELQVNHLDGFPKLEMIDYSTGEGYFLGYKLDVDKLNTDSSAFLEDIQTAKTNWKKYFKEEIEVGSFSQYI